MDWILFGHTALWLGILSWFDLRTREIPHSAWVVIPLLLAEGYRAWQGDWELVLLAALVATASERERLSHLLKIAALGRLPAWFPALFFAAALSIPTSPVTALAILAFWAAWELGWWGGADAVAAIVVCLFWPGSAFLLAFLLVHILATLGLFVSSLARREKARIHKIPGIPLLLLSVLLMEFVRLSPFIGDIPIL